jgi:MFS family permease
MLHDMVLAAQANPEAASILRGIFKGIWAIVVGIGSIIAAIVCGAIAAAKGRSALGWGLLGLFFSILTLIVIIVIPSKKS